jgi:hypothetical protein
LAAAAPIIVILDADKRYFGIRERGTPTNVIFALHPLPADWLSEHLAASKARLSQYADKRYFGCRISVRTNLNVVLRENRNDDKGRTGRRRSFSSLAAARANLT